MLAIDFVVGADDPEGPVRERMEPVVAELILQHDKDHHAHRHAQAQSENIYKRHQSVSLHTSESDLDIIPDHNPSV
jgi:hypothetical protein